MRPAQAAWTGLVLYVVAADVYLILHERKGKRHYYTMSTSFRISLSHSQLKWILALTWALLTLHLFEPFLPRRVKWFDLSRAYDMVRRAGGKPDEIRKVLDAAR